MTTADSIGLTHGDHRGARRPSLPTDRPVRGDRGEDRRVRRGPGGRQPGLLRRAPDGPADFRRGHLRPGLAADVRRPRARPRPAADRARRPALRSVARCGPGRGPGHPHHRQGPGPGGTRSSPPRCASTRSRASRSVWRRPPSSTAARRARERPGPPTGDGRGDRGRYGPAAATQTGSPWTVSMRTEEETMSAAQRTCSMVKIACTRSPARSPRRVAEALITVHDPAQRHPQLRVGDVTRWPRSPRRPCSPTRSWGWRCAGSCTVINASATVADCGPGTGCRRS